MCGIVGYVGRRPARELLLAGLRKLEYRGYDSAGISLMGEGRIEAVRAVGNLSALQAKLAGQDAAIAGEGAVAVAARPATTPAAERGSNDPTFPLTTTGLAAG